LGFIFQMAAYIQMMKKWRAQTMTDEAREARNAYNREWSKKNREHLKEYRAQYWARKAEESKRRQEGKP